MTEPEHEEIEPTEGQAEDRTDWKSESRKWEQRAKDNAAAAKRLAALEEAQKTAEQKAAEARSAAEKERDEARLELLQRDAADAANLPRGWASRLRGATKEELEADAKELAKQVAPKEPAATPPRPVPELRSGALPAGDQGQPFDGDAYIRAMARRK